MNPEKRKGEKVSCLALPFPLTVDLEYRFLVYRNRYCC
jgi:hypothetical protein